MESTLTGRQIGDFLIHEIIGRGPMSIVYRAVQQSVNRSVAMKLINFAANPLILENYQPYFMREARQIAALEHIHIVPVYHYGNVDDVSSFIAMRLLRGGSVADLLQDGPLPLEKAVDIFTQTTQGLTHAHAQGTIHRDLKPSNILIDDLGNAYLSDFGLGKLAEVSLDLTAAGHVIGTALYASPEQLNGDPIDTRSDIYSMGAILYHMLAGCPPFMMLDDGLAGLIQRQNTMMPTPPRELNPAISVEVNDLVMRSLSRQPDDRFRTMEDVAEGLGNALGRRITRSSDPAVYVSPPIAPPSRRKPRRRLAIGLVLVLTLIAVLVAAGLSATKPPSPATVVRGEAGGSEDAIPSSSEIAAARSRIGDNGFIAVVTCALESATEDTQAREMVERAGVYGLPLRVFDSERDAYKQITQIERARLEGAKAIILCALNSDSLEGSLESAQEAGIPLVYLTPQARTFGGVVVAASDDNASAQMAVDAAVRLLGGGTLPEMLRAA